MSVEQEIGIWLGTEKLSPDTIDAMNLVAEQTGIIVRRRCMMPENASAQTCKWRHQPVTASIMGTLPGLTEESTRGVYQQALSIWNASCNCGLQWSDDIDTANIWATCKNIDGSSGTLAWSFLIPCGGDSKRIRLEQRYDLSEGWSHDWALEVMLHELGHALGLNHSTQKGSLMYPFSSGGKILQPTKFELQIMVPLYGPPIASMPPGPPDAAPQIVGGVILLGADGRPVDIGVGGVINYNGHSYKLKLA